MGLLARLRERKAVDFTDLATALAKTTAGVHVSEGTALRLGAVWACVRVISEDVASLPLFVYERLERGRRRALEHPLNRLLHDQPNPEMTALQLRETLTAHALTWGNGYAYIVHAPNGRHLELWPLLPDRTRALRDPRTRELFYETEDPISDTKWRLDPKFVLHLAGLGWDGRSGYSPIQLHRQAIGLGMAAEEFGARFFGQGTNLGGFISHPGTLSEQAYKRLKSDPVLGMASYQGIERTHLWAIIEEGMKIEKIGIPPDEAQFIETRKFGVEEIARIYRVPPHKIQHLDRATFSNIEHQGIDYVNSTLRPWLVRWEQAIRLKLIPEDQRARVYAEHLVDGMLRGDILSRYSAYQIGRQGGWLSTNDIRERENLNPVDGGDDDYLRPLNMQVAGEPPPEPPNGQRTTPLKERAHV